ncbi:MAG: S8 family serine peptidase [Anaerolineae bacterium]
MRSAVSLFVRLLIALAICLVFTPGMTAASPGTPPPPATGAEPAPQPAGAPQAAPDGTSRGSDPSLAKLDPSLRSEAVTGSAETIAVLVIAVPGDTDFTRFGRVAADNTRPELNQRLVLLQLPASKLVKVAALPEVMAVASTHTNAAPAVADPEAPGIALAGITRIPAEVDRAAIQAAHANARPVDAAAAAANGAQTEAGVDSWFENSTQGVLNTWQTYAVYGTGNPANNLKIAVIDTGSDFCTPALKGRYAVETSDSRYNGWPIAYDDGSAVDFLLNYPAAGTGVGGNWGWYVNASRTVGEGPFTDDLYGLQVTTPNTSKSHVYYYGYHPDSLWNLAPPWSNVIVLVADTHTAGVYDTVYIDGDLDGTFTGPGDVVLTKTNPVGCVDWVGNSVADDSFGMLYWISDGVNPLPGVSTIYGGSTPVPANGRLVMFMLNDPAMAGGDHGTLVASSAAGYDANSYRDWQSLLAFSTGGASLVQGPASGGALAGAGQGARIIAMGDYYAGGSSIANYLFTLYGYDDTADGDDDAQIVNLSYGNGSVDADAWDYESEYISQLNLVMEGTGQPSPLFIISSGNGGHGYGTNNSPNAVTAMVVGASTEYGPYNMWGTYERISTAARANYQDMQPWSGRGPTAMGSLAPHVVANGAWGSGALPLNEATYYIGYGGDGSTAWEVWGGTSRSAPVAAGMATLVYDAYYKQHGVYPGWRTARQLVMNGATEMHYDEMAAGAGQANPYNSVSAVMGASGVQVSPGFYLAGTNLPGSQRYESSAVGLYPGQTDTTILSLANTTGMPQTVRLTDEQLQLVGSSTFTIAIAGTESVNNYAAGTPNYVRKLNDLIRQYAGADLMVVRIAQPFENFDQSPLPPTPGDTSFANRWVGLLYTVFDDGDGTWWTDSLANGRVDLTPHELDLGDAYIRTTYSYLKGTMQEMRMHSPSELLLQGEHPDIWLGLAKRTSDGRPTTMTVEVLFYLENDWGQASVSPEYVSLLGAADPQHPTTATATLTVAAANMVPAVVENFSSAAGWQTTGLWHLSNVGSDACALAVSAPGAMGYHQDAGCDYNTGGITSGTLTRSAALAVPSAPVVQLAFQSYEATECLGMACPNDIRSFQVSLNGTDWQTLWDSTRGSLENSWYERKVDLTAYAGRSVYLRFSFNSVTSTNNTARGWFIDDIRLLTAAADAAPGAYSGRVMVRSTTSATQTIVPVSLMVAANLQSKAVLGGGAPGQTPYDNNAMFGAMDWGGRTEAGDWRFFAYTMPDSLPAGTQVLVHTDWEDYPSDIDTLFFQQAAAWFPYPQYFGSYTLTYNGAGSARMGIRPNWLYYTNQGGLTGTQTDEYLAVQSGAGLSMLAQQAVLYGGHKTAVPVTTTLGLVSIVPAPLQLAGLACSNCLLPFTFTTNIDLPNGLAAGGTFGWYQPNSQTYTIMQGQTRIFSVTTNSTYRLEVSTAEVSGAPDIDLYLYKDNGDQVYNASDILYGVSAGYDANESIRLRQPSNGLWWIVVDGYTVTGDPGQFSLSIVNIMGAGALTLLNLPSSVTAGAVYTPVVRIDTPPAPGYWQGLVLFGPAEAPAVFELPVKVWQAQASLNVNTLSAAQGDLLTYTMSISVPVSAPPLARSMKLPIPAGTSYVAVSGAALMGPPDYVYWSGTDSNHTIILTVQVTAAGGTVDGLARFGADNWTGIIWCDLTTSTGIVNGPGFKLYIPLTLKN